MLINYSFPISKSGRVRVGIFPISDLHGETLIGVIAETTGKRFTCIGLVGSISEHNAYCSTCSLQYGKKHMKVISDLGETHLIFGGALRGSVNRAKGLASALSEVTLIGV